MSESIECKLFFTFPKNNPGKIDIDFFPENLIRYCIFVRGLCQIMTTVKSAQTLCKSVRHIKVRATCYLKPPFLTHWGWQWGLHTKSSFNDSLDISDHCFLSTTSFKKSSKLLPATPANTGISSLSTSLRRVRTDLS